MSRYQKLLEQYEQLTQEIEREREAEAERLVNLVVERVRQVLAEFHLDIDVVPRAAQEPHRRKRPTPKYWNPETGQTWCGRGRMPLWLAGKDPERYRVPVNGVELTEDGRN
ncbi:H-NS histone family protein [Burkholderia cenocepacia]|nr:H-NS histone family protein [Burkholderia cenocepacia]